MLRIVLLFFVVALTLPAWAQQKAQEPLNEAAVKKLADQTANWLIEQHDFKTGLFGKTKLSVMPGVVALAIRGLCEHHRKYAEDQGPFLSEPVKYLLKHKQPSGAITLPDSGLDTYNTALSIVALRATENPKHEEAIKTATSFLLQTQTDDGGFGYGKGVWQAGDMNDTWLALRALKGGDHKDTFQKALGFIRRCQDLPEVNPDPWAKHSTGSGGGFYRPGQSEAGVLDTREGVSLPKPYGSMTAALINAATVAGLKADSPELKGAMKWFQHNFTGAENPGIGRRGYFLYAFAFAEAMVATGVKELELADGRKVQWAPELLAGLLTYRQKDGSFRNTQPGWMEDDPILCTVYALNTINLALKAMK